MLDLGELHKHVQAMDAGDESARGEAINALKLHAEPEWTGVPAKVIHSLVDSLQKQIRSGTKQPSIRQDAVIILGKIGAPSEPAIPLLTELLQQGTPDGIREAAATALGKIGKASRGAVDQLVGLLSNHRATLVVQAIRALSEIGCADQRVKTALTGLWQPTSPAQKV